VPINHLPTRHLKLPNQKISSDCKICIIHCSYYLVLSFLFTCFDICRQGAWDLLVRWLATHCFTTVRDYWAYLYYWRIEISMKFPQPILEVVI
jgi:hypothetical protein